MASSDNRPRPLRVDPLGYRHRLAARSSAAIGILTRPVLDKAASEGLDLHEKHWLDCAGDVLNEREWQPC